MPRLLVLAAAAVARDERATSEAMAEEIMAAHGRIGLRTWALAA